jgi:hypothetical protein
MKINHETLSLMLKFGGAMLGLLLLVWVIALLTPKLAKLIDRLFGLHPKQTQPEAESYRVKDPWLGALNEAEDPGASPELSPDILPPDLEAVQNQQTAEENQEHKDN